LAGVKFDCLAFFDLAGAGAYGHGPPRGKALLRSSAETSYADSDHWGRKLGCLQPLATNRMNLPNQLTCARFVLTVLFVAILSTRWPFANTAGLVLFILAGITDYLDGAIARSRGLITDFGKLMDPLADKIMMASAFILLVPEGAFPAWVAVAIISREFAITGLRLLVANKGVVLPSESLGKHKTVWQIVAVIFYLLLLTFKEIERAGFISFSTIVWWEHAWFWGGRILISIVLILTIYSGVGYLWKNRALISMQ
jgi:CDP-diacylglycerol---glycerol-3-phosphate 3-phosphatidyltransferase